MPARNRTRKDDESAGAMVRLRMPIRNLVVCSATRPCLARLVTLKDATETDRLHYLHRQYVEPVVARFSPPLSHIGWMRTTCLGARTGSRVWTSVDGAESTQHPVDPGSVVVPVAGVFGVAVAVVDVVRVISVGHGDVAAVRAMLVGMIGVECVPARFALVQVTVVQSVQVPVVDVVGVVAVGDRDVAAACTVLVEVTGVLGVDRGGHGVTHLSCSWVVFAASLPARVRWRSVTRSDRRGAHSNRVSDAEGEVVGVVDGLVEELGDVVVVELVDHFASVTPCGDQAEGAQQA
ncbi:hypothetical protein ABH931_002718 [Streptacidiphilus sp. MAP12-33]